MKPKLIFDPEWMSMIEVFNKEQFFEFFMAFGKQIDVDEVKDPIVRGFYNFIKTQVDENLSKYKDKTLANKQNGMKGGRPAGATKKTQKNPNNPNNPTVIEENPNNHNTIQDNTIHNISLNNKTRQGRPPDGGKSSIFEKFKKLPPSISSQYEHAAKSWLYKQGEDPTKETITRIAATFYERNPDQYKEQNLPIYLQNRIE